MIFFLKKHFSEVFGQRLHESSMHGVFLILLFLFHFFLIHDNKPENTNSVVS